MIEVDHHWRQSCESAHCVRVQFPRPDEVRIGHGPESYLSFSRAEWDAFVAGVKAGDYDQP
jgi:hypothetical protein